MKIWRGDISIVTRTISVQDLEATGRMMRVNREKLKLSLRTVARRMNISAPYLSDLELGRRRWSEELFDSWYEAVRKENK